MGQAVQGCGLIKEVGMLKTIANMTFGVMIMVGLMMMAGSAGDCDGKCMEYANSLGDMMLYATGGLVLVIAGGFGLLNSDFTD